MIVLSLFDGYGGARAALDRAGIPVTGYYASEIDRWAMQVARRNYPDIVHIGDVRQVRAADLPRIDLVVGGSPCQGFSTSGKRLNFDDPRSALFFEYVRILREVQAIHPEVLFLLENVKMKAAWRGIISHYLGISPVLLNSALVSAQHRERLYWTNIAARPYGLFGDLEPGITPPADRGIRLADILEHDVPARYDCSPARRDNILNALRLQKRYTALDGDKSLTLQANYQQSWNGTYVSCIAAPHGFHAGGEQQQEKSNTLTGSAWQDNHFLRVRPSGALKKDSLKAGTLHGSGKDAGHHSDMDLIVQLSPGNPPQHDRLYDTAGVSPTLTASRWKPLILSEQTRIRRYTPVECERLQSLPDHYTAGVSETQRYKMLGNGFETAMVAHIFDHISRP